MNSLLRAVFSKSKKIHIVPLILSALMLIANAAAFISIFSHDTHDGLSADGLDTITFSEDTLELGIGETEKLLFAGIPSDIDISGEWSSSGGAVLVEDGTVTGVSAGEALVTFSTGALTAQARVLVNDNCLDRLTLAVEDIISDGYDITSADKLTALRKSLDGCSGSAKQACDFIDTLYAYAEGSVDAAAMNKQCDICDVPFEKARMAAESIVARSQLSEDTVTISLVGDCTLANRNDESFDYYFPSVYQKQDSPTYPADKIMHWFKADDLTIINHECAISEYEYHAPKKINFRSTPEYAHILADASVEIATLANNHAYDYREQGFEDTLACLDSLSIGTSYTNTPYITSIKGTEVVVISAGVGETFYNINDIREQVFAQLQEYSRRDNIVIVALHWGDEYEEIAYQYQIDAARDFVDAGANLVIGHHPHIVQGMEEYNGSVIAYSLGNFMYAGLEWTPDPQTFILRVTFGFDSNGAPEISQWSIVPCLVSGTRDKTVNNFQPVTLYGQEADDVAATIISRSRTMNFGVKSLNYF